MNDYYNASKDVLIKIEEVSRNRYEEERDREVSLISQASNMQTVFAVTTAALFMVLPEIISLRGTISLTFIFVSVSIISFFLVLSLVFATIAQWRFVVLNMPNVNSYVEGFKLHMGEVMDDERILIVDSIKLYSAIQENKFKFNNKRVRFIRLSMIAFFVATFLCLAFFLVGLYIILN